MRSVKMVINHDPVERMRPFLMYSLSLDDTCVIGQFH